MKFILGEKIKMDQIFTKDGTVIPVTLIKAGPCYVTQIKTFKKDKYTAVQIGFKKVKPKKLTKPEKGHLKKINQNLKILKEFRFPANKKIKLGDEIKVNIFKKDDKIQITAISKGKGFQGVVKKYGFSGSPASHGHKDQLRMPGSIGATDPARVFKGKKMAGQMGAKKITLKNLTVVKVDEKNNILYIKGAVPGAKGNLVKILSNN